jgi:hypothetical protein
VNMNMQAAGGVDKGDDGQIRGNKSDVDMNT